jgi:hypothetical protein
MKGPLRLDVAARLHGKRSLSIQHGTLEQLHGPLIPMNTGMLK